VTVPCEARTGQASPRVLAAGPRDVAKKAGSHPGKDVHGPERAVLHPRTSQRSLAASVAGTSRAKRCSSG
jgi:hypothetical protein